MPGPKINTAITAHTETANLDISTITSQQEGGEKTSRKSAGPSTAVGIAHKAAVNSGDIKKDVGT